MTRKALSPRMVAAYERTDHRWRSSYSMGVAAGTMQALERRGLVEALCGLGAIWDPGTNIRWRRTKKEVQS